MKTKASGSGHASACQNRHAKGTKWYSFMSCNCQITGGYTRAIARVYLNVIIIDYPINIMHNKSNPKIGYRQREFALAVVDVCP